VAQATEMCSLTVLDAASSMSPEAFLLGLLSPHVFSSGIPSVSVYLLISSSYKDTSQIELGSTQ
jgi:hypothetical protein